MRYSKQFKLRLMALFNEGNFSKSAFALEHHISRQTLIRWINLYNLFGENGLENKKRGVKETLIDKVFERKVLDLWNKKKRSVYQMRKDIQKESLVERFYVSRRQIQKIYLKWDLKKD